jgi:hypothetical protein
MNSPTAKALTLSLAVLFAVGGAVSAEAQHRRGGGGRPPPQSHGGGHSNNGGKIAAGIAAAAAAAILLGAASNRAGASEDYHCDRLADRCDDGERWACRKYRRECE